MAIVRAALVADPSILRDAIKAMQAGDAETQAAAARIAIGRVGSELARARGDPVAGNPDGDVTVVEFYDLSCPYCRQMLPVMAALIARDTRIRVVFKDIPVLGPPSLLGARAVLAAQRQDGYLKLQRAVMSASGTISETSLHEAAVRAGLDWGRLQHDMIEPDIQARIDNNLALAHGLGIEGTPSFVIGTKMLPGAISIEGLQAAVAAARGGRG